VAQIISLAAMRAGQTGRIKEIRGGHGMISKLAALGIRSGKEITKISSQWMRGPVLLRCGNTDLAIGFGMSRHIAVEMPEKEGET
jgi:ferrous iron transport protein A